MHVKTLTVVDPAASRLIDAAAEGKPIPFAVSDDADLLVVDALNRYRLALGVGRHGDLHVQGAVRHHPRQSLQAVLGGGIGGRDRSIGQLLLDLLAEVVTLPDGLHFVGVQSAAHDEPHLSAVGDEPFDTPGGKGKGVGREIAGHPVILHGTGEGRDVKETDEIPILVTVARLPGMGR